MDLIGENMVVTIKLRRKKVNMPDQGRVITVVWEDLFNPLIDSNGVIIRSDIINPVSGLLFPQYPEFVYSITIPFPVPTTQAAINALVDNSPELELAKIAAQTRAENIAAKAVIRTFVNVLNSGNKIDFEGTATIPV
jgi:hypothetical protein